MRLYSVFNWVDDVSKVKVRRLFFIMTIVVLMPLALTGATGAAQAVKPGPSPFPPTSLQAGSAFGKPFWEGKPKLIEKLRDDRAIIVSVRSEDGRLDPKAELFLMNGVGWVKRNAQDVFAIGQDYEALKTISEHFREVKHDAKSNRLFVICSALGYQARMLFQIRAVQADPLKLNDTHEIRFQVIDGHFLGLKGVVQFKPLPGEKGLSEVSARLEHEARELPIPRFLVGFALEIVVQRVAGRMRDHFEVAALPQPTPLSSPTPSATPVLSR